MVANVNVNVNAKSKSREKQKEKDNAKVSMSMSTKASAKASAKVYEGYTSGNMDTDDDGRAQYTDILDAVHGRGRFAAAAGAEPGEVYQHLMSKERRVLDTVDRVVNDARLFENERVSSFFSAPLHVICMRLVASVQAIMDELLEARSAQDVVNVFLVEERQIYVGLVLILVAIVVLVVESFA